MEYTIIYGRNPVKEALRRSKSIEKLYIQNSLTGEIEVELRQYAEAHNVPLSRIPIQKLDEISRRGNHQGVIAELAPVKYVDLDELLEQLDTSHDDYSVVLLLDGVTDVRNMGAIARSARAFGVKAMITESQGSAKINDLMIRSSAGAILDLPISRVRSLPIAIEALQQADYSVYAADIEGTTSLPQLPMTHKLAIVLGDEGKGVSKKTKQICDTTFSIDQEEDFDSLNVSVAAGIIMHSLRARIMLRSNR